MTITPEKVTEDLKYLVTLGGAYIVTEDHDICYRDGEPAKVVHNNKEVPIKLFNMKMNSNDECIYLKPFNDVSAICPDRKWFWTSQNCVMATTVKMLIIKTIEEGIDLDESTPSKAVELLDKYADKVDAKLLKEIGELNMMSFIDISYFKKHKSAQAFCSLLDPEEIETIGNIRKRSIKILQSMLLTLLGTENVSELYTAKASGCSCMESEARLRVELMLYKTLNPFIESILGKDRKVDIDRLTFIIENLNGYMNKTKWMTDVTEAPVTKETTTPAAPSPAVQVNPNTTQSAVVGTPGQVAAPTVSIVTRGSRNTAEVLQQQQQYAAYAQQQLMPPTHQQYPAYPQQPQQQQQLMPPGRSQQFAPGQPPLPMAPPSPLAGRQMHQAQQFSQPAYPQQQQQLVPPGHMHPQQQQQNFANYSGPQRSILPQPPQPYQVQQSGPPAMRIVPKV